MCTEESGSSIECCSCEFGGDLGGVHGGTSADFAHVDIDKLVSFLSRVHAKSLARMLPADEINDVFNALVSAQHCAISPLASHAKRILGELVAEKEVHPVGRGATGNGKGHNDPAAHSRRGPSARTRYRRARRAVKGREHRHTGKACTSLDDAIWEIDDPDEEIDDVFLSSAESDMVDFPFRSGSGDDIADALGGSVFGTLPAPDPEETGDRALFYETMKEMLSRDDEG